MDGPPSRPRPDQWEGTTRPDTQREPRHAPFVLESNTTYRPLSRNRHSFTNTMIVSFASGDGSTASRASSPGLVNATLRPEDNPPRFPSPQISPRTSGFEPSLSPPPAEIIRPTSALSSASAIYGSASVIESVAAYGGQAQHATPSLNLPPHLSLQLHTFVCLDIGRTTTASSLYILRTCAVLQDLTIRLIPDDPLSQSHPLPRQVLASQLHHLHIKTMGGDPRGIFTRLNTPVLESFTLIGEPHFLAMDDVFATSATMLEDSWAPLQRLSLIDVFPPTDQLGTCLVEAGKMLSHLIVHIEAFNRGRDIPTYFGNRVISDQLLNFLTATTVCPSLKVLQLSPIRSTDGVLSTLIASRKRSLQRFTYSIIDGSPHRVDMDALSRLRGGVVTVPFI